MSVPVKDRSVSKTEYIYRLCEFNDYVSTFVYKKIPVKYRKSYGDTLIYEVLKAYLLASKANRISIREGEPIENFDNRIKILQEVLEHNENTELVTQLIINCLNNVDHQERVKLISIAQKIGGYRSDIDKLVKGNIKYVRDKKKQEINRLSKLDESPMTE